MLVGFLTDPVLRSALPAVASPEEDVLLGGEAAFALRYGFPRAVVYEPELRPPLPAWEGGRSPRLLPISAERRRAWDAERRSARVLRSREAFATERMRALLAERAAPTWVDQAFRDLSRAAGAPLPAALRGFGRRAMELPARYDDLRGLCLLTGLTRGALKARFRRRGLASPSCYLRWFRALAAAHVLRDDSVTTLEASARLRYTTGGNFCRTILSTTGLTTTELRPAEGWQRLVVSFAVRYLMPPALERWASLNGLFLPGRVA